MSKTPIKISINPETDTDSIEAVLAAVFWKEPEMVSYAKAFLSHIKDWAKTESPYQASDWHRYCTRAGLTQSRYSNMLKRLRRSGLVEKKYDRNRKTHYILPSESFSRTLSGLSSAWKAFNAL